ncbi:unnamed protein product [Musa banksii]
MEAAEEASGIDVGECGSCNGEFLQPAVVAKGKRTKRQRSHPRLHTVLADSSSTSSSEHSESITEEDEDVANCLILLAQGRARLTDSGPGPEGLPGEAADGDGGGVAEKSSSRRPPEAGTTTGCAYECKTCSRWFPSFQALGGHRASHKKPKLTAATTIAIEERKESIHDHLLQTSTNPFSHPVRGVEQSNTKPKTHECSICGSEFSSGQALGGHMRRHRPPVAAIPESQDIKKERFLLPLDLNLPAPINDDAQIPPPPASPFAPGRPLVFAASASALVDCRY